VAYGNYEKGSITTTLTVTQATPSLGSFSIPSVAYNENVTITPPTSNSNGEFTYTGNNSSVATITSSGIVTITGVGSVTIIATQAATGIYSQGSVSATLTVNAIVPSLSNFNIPSGFYRDGYITINPPTTNSPGNFSYTITNQQADFGWGGVDFLTIIDGNIIRISYNMTGTATILATCSPAGNYTFGYIYATFTIKGDDF
jgi:hypothetical protein